MQLYVIEDKFGAEWYRANSADEARRLFMVEHALHEKDMTDTEVSEVKDPSHVYVTVEVTADTLMDGPAGLVASTDV